MMRDVTADAALREACLALGEAILQQRLMAIEVVRLEEQVARLTPDAERP